MVLRRATAFLLCLLCSASASAGSANLKKAAEDPLLRQALIDLYNLDYGKTRAGAERFIELNPKNPLGYLFLSGCLWWQATTENGMLAERPQLREHFDEMVDRTVEVAKEQIRSKDDAENADGHFTSGMVLGLRGQMKLADDQLLKAYKDGKKAIRHLNKCVKIDPEYYDAYLGLGIFDYQIAVLPGVFRLGAKLLLSGTGNAERGLRNIRTTIDKGYFASRQASTFLLSLYILFERDYERGLKLCQEIRRSFPESPYYAFVEAALLHRTGNEAASWQRARELFDRLAREPESFQRKQRGTVCGLLGPQCLDRENLQGAVTWLSRALAHPADAPKSELPGAPGNGKKAPHAPRHAASTVHASTAPAAGANGERPHEGWESVLRLYRGLAHDALGQRAEARADFLKTQELPDFAGSRAWASFCRDRGCGKEELLRYMRGDSAH